MQNENIASFTYALMALAARDPAAIPPAPNPAPATKTGAPAMAAVVPAATAAQSDVVQPQSSSFEAEAVPRQIAKMITVSLFVSIPLGS